jgi:drug/metabolite transporter (DMT)-like permease
MTIAIAYLTVILIWSTTPLAIKWSAMGSGFAFAVMARMAIGAALAALLVAALHGGLPLHRRARASYLAAGLGMFGAMLCTYWGAQYINSGLVSVLFGLSPLITSLLAVLWLGEHALRPSKLLGMVLGLAGLSVIFAGGAELGGAHATAGVTALLLAVVIYSASLVWVKRIGDDSPALATTSGSLLVALPLFIAAWLLTDGHVPHGVPARASAAIVYLGMFGSVLGFSLYYHIVRHLPAGSVALITLVTPVLALLLGNAANGEPISPRVMVGAACITAGLAVHQWPSVAAAWRPPRLRVPARRSPATRR